MSERRIRVLLCEHSTVHHAGLAEGFRFAFSSAGYDATIEISESIDDALRLLGRGDFEILLTDLSFGKDVAVGLDFVRKVKNSHPHVYIVACSSNSPTVEMTRNKRPTFDLFIPKWVVLNPRPGELERIGQEIHTTIGCLMGLTVRVAGTPLEDMRVSGEKITAWELRSLVAQVLSDLNCTDDMFRPTEALFTPIAGGYSGSLVGILTLAGTAGLRFVKTIVKISLAKWALDEADNFRRYAKWMLPFNKRVELVGVGRTHRFGAVAYAFVFGGEEEFFNLTKIIRNHDAGTLERYIQTIFDNELVTFYNATQLNSDVNIGQHYRERYFPDERLEDSARPFRNVIQRYLGGREEGLNWRIGEELYPDPFRVLLSGTTKKFTLSICHGDLNSDNVICTPDGRVAYIDFQDTGPGHLLQDFAALESSIRLNWGLDGQKPSSKSGTSLLKREWSLARGSTRSSAKIQYDKPCIALRTVARNRFPKTEKWEYSYAIGALSLKLMRVRGFNDAQLCRLAACALVSTMQFESLRNGAVKDH